VTAAAVGQKIASAVRHREGVIAVREEFSYFPRSERTGLRSVSASRSRSSKERP